MLLYFILNIYLYIEHICLNVGGYEDHQDVLPLVLHLVHQHEALLGPGPGEVVDVMENLDSSMNMAAPNTCPAL